MITIKHKFVIKATAEIIFNALTTQEGSSGWWAKQTIAKPEIGFVNEFTFGTVKNEIQVADLVVDKKVVWKVLNAAPDWNGTTISFDIEAKEDKAILRFAHADWQTDGDFFAECNFAWARFMISLKSYCETGTPS
ncbi:MAG: SRPBCC domain-containing protein [Spirosomataceae bacterium]